MGATARTAVVGAGSGGLLCAGVLQRHGVDVLVYDADASVDARDPGGKLGLHADSGQIALEDAGLMGAFYALDVLMAGATVFHVGRKEYRETVLTLALLAVALFVGVGHTTRVPLV